MLVAEIEIIVTKDGAEIFRKIVRPGDCVIGREPGCDAQFDADLVACGHSPVGGVPLIDAWEMFREVDRARLPGW